METNTPTGKIKVHFAEKIIREIPDVDDIKNKLDKLEVFARSILHLINDIRADIRNGGFDKK